jgi:membrane-associated protease RseP (regulator of RpoE activity)
MTHVGGIRSVGVVRCALVAAALSLPGLARGEVLSDQEFEARLKQVVGQVAPQLDLQHRVTFKDVFIGQTLTEFRIHRICRGFFGGANQRPFPSSCDASPPEEIGGGIATLSFTFLPGLSKGTQNLIGITTGPSSNGVSLTSVGADSPAAKAGLKQGDIIVGGDGKPIATEPDLLQALQSSPPGASFKVEFRRGDRQQTETVDVDLKRYTGPMPGLYDIRGVFEASYYSKIRSAFVEKFGSSAAEVVRSELNDRRGGSLPLERLTWTLGAVAVELQQYDNDFGGSDSYNLQRGYFRVFHKPSADFVAAPQLKRGKL